METYKTYKEYLRHPEFLRVRALAMEKAKRVCQDCKLAFASEVHHLKYPKWGTFDNVENLIPICHLCHCKRHGKES